MSRFGRGAPVVAVATLCAGWFGSAAAVDPLVLFLLKMLRDSVISSAIEAGVEASTKPATPADPLATLPRLHPPPPEGQCLKQLIDESFVHLSAAERDELHVSLMRILNDPRHLESRGLILSEFTRHASAMTP